MKWIVILVAATTGAAGCVSHASHADPFAPIRSTDGKTVGLSEPPETKTPPSGSTKPTQAALIQVTLVAMTADQAEASGWDPEHPLQRWQYAKRFPEDPALRRLTAPLLVVYDGQLAYVQIGREQASVTDHDRPQPDNDTQQITIPVVTHESTGVRIATRTKISREHVTLAVFSPQEVLHLGSTEFTATISDANGQAQTIEWCEPTFAAAVRPDDEPIELPADGAVAVPLEWTTRSAPTARARLLVRPGQIRARWMPGDGHLAPAEQIMVAFVSGRVVPVDASGRPSLESVPGVGTPE